MNFTKYIAVATITTLALTGVSSVFAAQTVDNTVNITTIVNDTLTATVSSATVALGNITSGTATTGAVTLRVTTNAQAGFDVLVQRTNSVTTLLHTDAVTTIADNTVWTPGTPNAAVFAPLSGLGFRVNATGTTAASRNAAWWGADDTNALAKFAGLPSAYALIYDGTGYANSQQDVALGFKLDVPATQNSGTYSGDISLRVQTSI